MKFGMLKKLKINRASLSAPSPAEESCFLGALSAQIVLPLCPEVLGL